LEFGGQSGDEALANSTLRHRIVSLVELDHSLPPLLPGLVGNDSSGEVCPIVVVDVVPIDPVQKAIRLGNHIPRQISAVL